MAEQGSKEALAGIFLAMGALCDTGLSLLGMTPSEEAQDCQHPEDHRDHMMGGRWICRDCSYVYDPKKGGEADASES